MSTPVVQNAAGFELPDGHRRAIRWLLYIAFAAVSVGFINGLGQALGYAGINIYQYFPGMRSYYQGLTVHGVFNAIVFTFSFTNGFLALTTSRALGRPVDGRLLWAVFGLTVAGVGLASWAMFSGNASVLYTFYPPLQAHWTYYLGLALLVIATWVMSAAMLLALSAWRKEHPGERIPLLAFVSIATYVMWDIASVGIAVEVVGFLLPWSLGLIEGSDPLLSRTLFWFSGHPIVYFWLLPAYVSWYCMVPKHAGGTLFSDTLTRTVFLMFLVLSIPVGFHHQFTDPGIQTGFKAVHAVLTFGVLYPSLVTLFSVMWALETGARRRGGRGLVRWWSRLNWKDPVLVAQILAMVTFLLGGITGLVNASFNMNMVVHNTTWVPGHFHMTVASAVTMSFMGIAYWLIPYLTKRRLVGRRIALAQAWTYFLGVLIFARGMIQGGLDGMPRRTAMSEAPYRQFMPEWDLAGILTGVGGSLMFVGALLFFVVFLATIFFGARQEDAGDIPFTETAEPPATEGWVVGLDRFRYWVAITILLILIAYGPFIVQYLPPNLTSPGQQIF
ncbi:MAG: cbb3-type cytochrome c oxidase subunit I [Gemmatimonadota bacterium]|jgi:cytochrome c oxidase subunit 1